LIKFDLYIFVRITRAKKNRNEDEQQISLIKKDCRVGAEKTFFQILRRRQICGDAHLCQKESWWDFPRCFAKLTAQND
jgi:hypothetical protein